MMHLQIFAHNVPNWPDDAGLLYDSLGDERAQLIQTPLLSMELNAAGSLTYTVPAIPTDNPALSMPKMTTILEVRYNDEIIWTGRPVSEEIDIDNTRTVTCEGALAFMNDILIRPYNEPEYSIQQIFARFAGTYARLCSPYRSIEPGELILSDEYAKKILKVIGGESSQNDESTGVTIAMSDLHDVVYAVINGDYGVWPERQANLEAAGYDYAVVQDLVNRVMWGQEEGIDWAGTVAKYGVSTTDTVQINQQQIKKEIKKEMPGSALSEIFEVLVNEYGGYLRLRYGPFENGRPAWMPYLDYILSYDESASHGITFGENILDYSESKDTTEIYTGVIAYGKTKSSIERYAPQGITEDEKKAIFGKLTLSDATEIPDGSWRIYEDNPGVADPDGVSQYGLIERAVEYSDIDDFSYLRNASVQALDGAHQPSDVISITAIDLALFYDESRPIKVGYIVPVYSNLHLLSANLQCTSVEYDFSNPESSTFTFGSDFSSFTDSVVSGAITNGGAVVRQGGSSMYNGGYLTDTLRVNQAYIQSLEAMNVTTQSLKAATAYITELEAMNISTAMLSAAQAYIEDLRAGHIESDTATIRQAYIEELLAGEVVADQMNATVAYISYLLGDAGEFHSLTVDKLRAQDASIENLNAEYAQIGNLYVTKATIEDAYITKAQIADLYATKANVNTLLADYIKATEVAASYLTVDAANITQAAIQHLFADTNILKNVNVTSQLAVTGELNAVTLNADRITAGTLVADRLLLTGDNGLYYALNVNAMGQATVNQLPASEKAAIKSALHGKSIVADTITAAQIAANTITANEIAANTITANEIAANTITGAKIAGTDLSALKASIGGMHLTSSSLYSGSRSSASSNSSGFYLDSNGNLTVGDGDEYIKFVNGALSMKIASFSSILNSSGTSVEGVMDSKISANSTSLQSTIASAFGYSTIAQTGSGITASITNAQNAADSWAHANLIPNTHRLSTYFGWLPYNSNTVTFNRFRTATMAAASGSSWKGFSTPYLNARSLYGKALTFSLRIGTSFTGNVALYIQLFSRTDQQPGQYGSDGYLATLKVGNLKTSTDTTIGRKVLNFTCPTSMTGTDGTTTRDLSDTKYLIRFVVVTSVADVEWSVSDIKLEYGTVSSTTYTVSPLDDVDQRSTNFLSFTSDGLIVGDQSAGTLKRNILLNDSQILFRNGSTNLGWMSATEIMLGANSNSSIIKLCNNVANLAVGTYKIDNTSAERFAILADRDILIRTTGGSKAVHIYGADNGTATSANDNATRVKVMSNGIMLDVGHDANYNWGSKSAIELNKSRMLFRVPNKYYYMSPELLDYSLCTKLSTITNASGTWQVFGYGYSNSGQSSWTYSWIRAYARISLGPLAPGSFTGTWGGWRYFSLKIFLPVDKFHTIPYITTLIESPRGLYTSNLYYIHGGTSSSDPAYIQIHIAAPSDQVTHENNSYLHVYCTGKVN